MALNLNYVSGYRHGAGMLRVKGKCVYQFVRVAQHHWLHWESWYESTWEREERTEVVRRHQTRKRKRLFNYYMQILLAESNDPSPTLFWFLQSLTD